MDVKEIGEVLKNARENQGVTWEYIYSETKISPYILQHLEEGRLDGLPHPVYLKGFIKNYAQILGLNSQELAQEFAQTLSLDKKEEEQKKKNVLKGSHSKLKFAVSIVLLVLLIVSWFLFKGFFYTSSRNTAQINQKAEKNFTQQNINIQKHNQSAELPTRQTEVLNKTTSPKKPQRKETLNRIPFLSGPQK